MLALRALPFVLLAACAADDGRAPLASEPAPPASRPAEPPRVDGGSDGAPAAIPLPPSGRYMGATPVTDGVDFRVWAPNATAVAVAVEGDMGRHPLAREDGGTFAGHVEGAHAGQKYTYAITTADGRELQRLDPRGRAVDGGMSVVVDPRTYAWKTSAFRAPAREQAVVYELHVGAFAGTFRAAIDRLDALADLGVNVVELMPVQAFGGHNGWGYNPESYYAPHAPYGTPDDLRALVDGAHARGIAVVLDVVFNHYENWSKAPLWCFDGACPDGGAGAYFFQDDAYRKTPWGPRPDYSNPNVRDFIVDNVFAWMSEYRIDGFRWDSVSNIRAIDGQGTVPGGVDLLRRANEVSKATSPSSLLVAEDLKGEASITEARSAGGLGFDTQWDGGFYGAVTNAVTAADDGSRNLSAVVDALRASYASDPFARLLYVETHDTAGNDGARLPVRIDEGDPTGIDARKRTMLAAGVLLTAPGVPMLFMGQESLTTEAFGSPPSLLASTIDDASARVRAFHRDMIRLRRNLDGGAAGLASPEVVVTHVNATATDHVIAYRRGPGSPDDVMVVANFGGRRYTRYDIGLPSGGAWRARVDGDDVRYGADFGASSATGVTVTSSPRDGLPATGSVALGPYAIVVLTR